MQLHGFNKSSGKCACQSTELWALPGAPGAVSLVFATVLRPSVLRGAAAGFKPRRWADWISLSHAHIHAHKQNDDDGKTQDGKCGCQDFLGSREEDGERPRELRGGGQIPCEGKQSRQKYKKQEVF